MIDSLTRLHGRSMGTGIRLGAWGWACLFIVACEPEAHRLGGQYPDGAGGGSGGSGGSAGSGTTGNVGGSTAAGQGATAGSAGAGQTSVVASELYVQPGEYPRVASDLESNAVVAWYESGSVKAVLREGDLDPAGWSAPAEVAVGLTQGRVVSVGINKPAHAYVAYLDKSSSEIERPYFLAVAQHDMFAEPPWLPPERLTTIGEGWWQDPSGPEVTMSVGWEGAALGFVDPGNGGTTDAWSTLFDETEGHWTELQHLDGPGPGIASLSTFTGSTLHAGVVWSYNESGSADLRYEQYTPGAGWSDVVGGMPNIGYVLTTAAGEGEAWAVSLFEGHLSSTHVFGSGGEFMPITDFDAAPTRVQLAITGPGKAVARWAEACEKAYVATYTGSAWDVVETAPEFVPSAIAANEDGVTVEVGFRHTTQDCAGTPEVYARRVGEVGYVVLDGGHELVSEPVVSVTPNGPAVVAWTRAGESGSEVAVSWVR